MEGIYMSTLIKIFLIISNFLLFCFKTVFFVLAGAYLVFYPFGGISAITAHNIYRLGALLLPTLANLVMLFFLFDALKSFFLINIIFLFINGITAIHYATELFWKIRLYMRLGSGSYLRSIDQGINTMQNYTLVFFTVIFTLNTLVMLGVIPIHKKDKEQPAAEGAGTTLTMMEKLKGKKRSIGVLVILLAGVLLWGARAYFFAPSLSSASFEWVAKPQYKSGTDFSSGVAWVKIKGNEWRQIDTQGNILIDYYEAYDVSRYDKETGLAAFTSTSYSNGFKSGFINLSGEVVISPDYSYALDFQHGMAPVAKKTDGKYRYGIIDRHGKVILPLVYERIRPLSPHVFAVKKTEEKEGDPYNGEKWMYINEKGQPISDRIFEFKHLDGNPRPSNTTFHTTLPPNLYLAGVDGKVGLINDKGEWVLPASYDIIYQATQEPIGVLKDGKVGFIDLKFGEYLDLDNSYYQFSEGLAVVVPAGSVTPKGEIPKSGVINEKGELLFTLPGKAKKVYGDGVVVVRTKDRVEGLVDRKGNWYPLPPSLAIWTNIVSDGMLRVVKEENDGKYMNLGMFGYIKVKINPKE